MSFPLLSILIPLYNYKYGIDRLASILLHVSQCATPSSLEIIVHDDSKYPLLSSCELSSIQSRFPFFKYRHNSIALGACGNWNSLLDRANGFYIWFIHHDEYPVFSPDSFSILLRLLSHQSIDLIVLPIFKSSKVSILGLSFRFGCFHSRPDFLLPFCCINPFLLLHVNVIGPPSSLIVKRSCASRFNSQLTWLIDVDWYIKNLQNIDSSRLFFFPRSLITVVGDVSYEGSITRQISSSINSLRSLELFILDPPRSGFAAILFVLYYWLLRASVLVFSLFTLKFYRFCG